MAKLLFLQEMEYEYIGPTYLSAVAKRAGHDCGMGVGRTVQDFEQLIGATRPDIVGFSTMTGSHDWAVGMAGKIKAAYGIPNVFGGPHPTFFPELIEEPTVDMIVRGEGEGALCDILDRLDARASLENVQNLCLKRSDGTIIRNELRPLMEDLDALPFPDRHLYDCIDGRIDRSLCNVVTTRGCPYKCNFCCQDALRELYRGKGKYVRTRRIEKVIEECVQLKNESGARAIYFRDDLFGLNKKWLYEFLKLYKREVGLEFMCLVRADIVCSDEQYASRLAEAGCRTVFWGIESGDEQMRNLVLNKQLANEQIIKAAGFLHRAGIKFLTFNIMGLPGETLANAQSTVELNIAIRTDYPWCSLYFPLPRTRLTEYALDNGYLDPNYHATLSQQTFYSSPSMRSPEIDRIENLQRFFQTAVLWPWTYPLIKKLIHLRPNLLFKWWFGLIYFYVHTKGQNLNFWLTLKFAIRNVRHQFGKK